PPTAFGPTSGKKSKTSNKCQKSKDKSQERKPKISSFNFKFICPPECPNVGIGDVWRGNKLVLSVER
ncbi:MAG TPA: hypothetical protein PLA19_05595, partial [Candidatus Pacearchaeota archaeon]|nr:hypothetical protein [Candidatus Pacearchaeota archaeon]